MHELRSTGELTLLGMKRGPWPIRIIGQLVSKHLFSSLVIPQQVPIWTEPRCFLNDHPGVGFPSFSFYFSQCPTQILWKSFSKINYFVNPCLTLSFLSQTILTKIILMEMLRHNHTKQWKKFFKFSKTITSHE